jgi:hypothetical protein
MASFESFHSKIEETHVLLWEFLVHFDHLVNGESHHFCMFLVCHDRKLPLSAAGVFQSERFLVFIHQHVPNNVNYAEVCSFVDVDVCDV